LSSILKALKKLDEDSMSLEPGTNEQKQEIKMRQMVTRRTRAPRVMNRIFFIILVVLLVGLAALIFMSSIISNKKPLVTKKQDDIPKKPALTQLPRQSPTLTKDSQKESPEESKPPAAGGERLKPSTKEPFPVSGQPVQPDTSRAAETIQPAADQKLDNQAANQEQLIKQTETEPPGLILNGVLWSDNPDRRVALINDRYLKEGDVFEGVSVVKIERKAVILQLGEKKWTLSVKK
jgi:cytoskeletal protein RodZ